MHWHQAHARKKQNQTEYEFLHWIPERHLTDDLRFGDCGRGRPTLVRVLVLITVARRRQRVSKRPRCDQPSPLSSLASLKSRYVPYQNVVIRDSAPQGHFASISAIILLLNAPPCSPTDTTRHDTTRTPELEYVS